MPRRKLLGWRPCRWEGHRAEVREDKNGNPYLICEECEPFSQEFTYGHKKKVEVLLGAGFEPVGNPAPAPAPAPAPEVKPAPTKKKSGLLIGGGDDD